MMIPLYVDQGAAYVWNAENWHSIRVDHRICGALIGSIPSFPRQNDFQGLPMALMSEEAALLVEKGICQLIELPNLNKRPSDEDKQNIELNDKVVLEQQTDALRKNRIEQLSQKIDIIVAGKKQKLMSKGICNIELDKETLLHEEINKLPKVSPAHILVHLPTEHFIDTEKKIVQTDALSPGVLDIKGSIRYAIFKDLWEQGYHLTCGSKFGVDYLVYPGDPVRFHALYMVRCVTDHTRSFRPANLVAFGRLSVAVNKLAVLAFCNALGKIEYQTLQWHDTING